MPNPVSSPSRHPTLLARVLEHAGAGGRPAIVEPAAGVSATYSDLVQAVAGLQAVLRETVGEDRLRGARVLNLLPQGYAWAVAQLALWSAGAVNVPQPPGQALGELRHVVGSAGVEVLVAAEPRVGRGAELGLRHAFAVDPRGGVSAHHGGGGGGGGGGRCDGGCDGVRARARPRHPLPAPPLPDPDSGAMMLFTSGTTGRPKGVVSSHRAIAAQCRAMGEAWAWSSRDRLLHVLPLTHIHGVINCLAVPLWHGATVEFTSPKFSPSSIWERLMSPAEPLTLLMAVPTIYSRLLAAYAALPPDLQQSATRSCRKQLRLCVSGSAPLPSTIKRGWEAVTGGSVLLERYGMTETGMILGNPLEPAEERLDGHVGLPLPGVEVRLWTEGADGGAGRAQHEGEREAQGEVQVKGESLFQGYWQLPEGTAAAFTADGWFKTGDIAVRSAGPKGYYRLLGRSSADIIKSGGEKISALEVERVLHTLPELADAAVLGVPDPQWGEAVAAVVVFKPGAAVPEAIRRGYEEDGARGLRDRLRAELSAFKLPKRVKVYPDEIPRNAMGKIDKKALRLLAFPEVSESA